MKKGLLVVGLLVTLSPILATAFGFLYCVVSPSNICLAVPFAWMLMWPAYIIGVVIISFSALIPVSKVLTQDPVQKLAGPGTTQNAGWSTKILPVSVIAGACLLFLHLATKELLLKNERREVLKFVVNNDSVKAAAGSNFEVFPESEAVQQGYPVKYIVSVSSTRDFSVIVNVSRSWWHSHFNLACISYVKPGDRDPFRDECSQ